MSAERTRSDLIAIIGATGVVGREAITILESRGVDRGRIVALASERSVGSLIPYAGDHVTVESADTCDFAGVSVALFCASADVAQQLSPRAIRAGATAIDNSSAFRLRQDVPLVVPEINHATLAQGPSLIANPNCSAVILTISLEPLRNAFGLAAIDLATYQAVSGAGQGGIDDLLGQVNAAAAGRAQAPTYFREPCLFNVFSHDSAVEPDAGLNVEERKIIDEARKIWSLPTLRITPTCVRVPVLRAHTQAITVELSRPASEREVREAFASARGVRVIDDRATSNFPTPLKAAHGDDVLVGRIRPDPGTPLDAAGRSTRWCVLACGDQLRKGAALNAVQIAECLGLVEPSVHGASGDGSAHAELSLARASTLQRPVRTSA